MALTFEELLPIASAQESASGVTDTTRIFKVPGNTPEDALANPSLRSAPPTGAAIGSLHPRNPAGQQLKCSGYRVGERIGAGTEVGYRVYAIYRPQGVSLGGPPPDTNNPVYYTRGMSTSVSTIGYPIIARYDTSIPDPLGGTPLKGYEWQRTDYEAQIITTSYSIQWTSTSWTAANANAVATQMNRIHSFDGGATYWRFIGSDVAEAFEAGKWSVTYRWENESNTPQTVWGSWQNGSIWTDATVIEIPARVAFQRWYVTYITNPDSLPSGYQYQPKLKPKIVVRTPWVIDFTGYQTLPGYNAPWVP